MTSMRRCYVASTSLGRHVPAGKLAPPCPPPPPSPNILNLPTPMKRQQETSQELTQFIPDPNQDTLWKKTTQT